MSVSMNGVLLPETNLQERTGTCRLVPAGHLDVQLDLGGSRQVRAITAVSGQRLALAF